MKTTDRQTALSDRRIRLIGRVRRLVRARNAFRITIGVQERVLERIRLAADRIDGDAIAARIADAADERREADAARRAA